MNEREFNNDKSILRKEIVRVSLDDENNISKIEYCTPGGTLVKKYQYFNTSIFERLNKYKIMQMAYILCLFDTKKFYELYKTLNSDSDKEAMLNGLESVLNEYKQFITSDTIDSAIELPLSIDKEFSTLGNSLSISDNKITLNKNNYIDTCNSLITTNDYSYSVSYNRNQRIPYTENNIQYRTLNENVCREFSKQLCRSDIKEYQRLINSTSYRDPYYSSIIEGGNSFANEVKRLVRKCN